MIVSTSMLPGNGMNELSASPRRIRPGPPSRKSHFKPPDAMIHTSPARIALLRSRFRLMGWCAGREYLLHDGFRRFPELDWERVRQGATFVPILVEKPQAFQAGCIQVVVNVFKQVGLYFVFRQSDARRPELGDAIEIVRFEAVIP